MHTSHYQAAGQLPNAVAISRGKPDWFKGAACDLLAPPYWMLKLETSVFIQAYQEKVLAKLDPADILKILKPDAIMLCWEPFNVFCHRRMVAEWLEKACGAVIPELGHAREESLPYEAMPAKLTKATKSNTLWLF